MITTDTSMKLEHFHDFYFLQALRVSISQEISKHPALQFSHTVVKLQEDLNEYYNDIVPNMALRVFTYLFAACLGEARHARSNSADRRFVREILTAHRSTIFQSISDFEPSRQNIQALVDVFSQNWCSGFGGEAWKSIAKALHEYYTLPPATWLDHVVDLEHNNGTAFSKTDACDTILFDTRYPFRFNNFLDYKFRYNIIEQSDGSHAYHLTRPAYKLIQRYAKIFHKSMPWWIEAGLQRLTEYDVQWGQKTITLEDKWLDGIDVSSGNSPHAQTLLYMAGADDVYAPSKTAKELKKMASKFKAKAKKIAGKHMTKKFAARFNAKLTKWLEECLEICKADKMPITYAALPFTVEVKGWEYVFHFPLPCQGIGTPEEGGFFVTTTSVYGNVSQLLSQKEGFIVLNNTTLIITLSEYDHVTIKYKPLEALLD
jgi:hypothetical protein